ncbi:MAG TPA: hypothetical protein VF510_25575 [Ktedonobacterales bacterium]
MQEMDRRIALLRLLLADITGRERETGEAIAQLRKQLTRVVDFTVQYNGSVAGALSSLAEVEERLAQQEGTLRHLRMLRERASGELQALVVTRGVTDARTRLTELEAQRRALVSAGDETTVAEEVRKQERRIAEIDAEIADLLAQIQAASEAAARALTSGGSSDSPQQHAGTDER